jgi:capsular polysaccharide biosynthesis protein
MDTEKISNVIQIQPAKTPLKPVSPNVPLNLVIGFFLGGLGSLGLAFFLEHMDDRLEKRDDTERALKLPVLASIPELRT